MNCKKRGKRVTCHDRHKWRCLEVRKGPDRVERAPISWSGRAAREEARASKRCADTRSAVARSSHRLQSCWPTSCQLRNQEPSQNNRLFRRQLRCLPRTCSCWRHLKCWRRGAQCRGRAWIGAIAAVVGGRGGRALDLGAIKYFCCSNQPDLVRRLPLLMDQILLPAKPT